MDLAAAILGDPQDVPQGLELRQGVVTAVSLNTVTVKVGSATTGVVCSTLASYGASVGDVVSVLVLKGDRIVIGKAGPGRCGFYITRNTNDGAIVSTGSSDITFNHIVEATWSTFNGFTSGAGLTVPPDGAGWYQAWAGVYSGGVAALGVYVGVTVNNVLCEIPDSTSMVSSDRWYSSGLVKVAAGDVIRLHVGNFSAVTITPTAYSGDLNTPPLPALKMWRIST